MIGSFQCCDRCHDSGCLSPHYSYTCRLPLTPPALRLFYHLSAACLDPCLLSVYHSAILRYPWRCYQIRACLTCCTSNKAANGSQRHWLCVTEDFATSDPAASSRLTSQTMDSIGQLLHLRQGGLIMEEYVHQFCELSYQVPLYDESLFKDLFYFGLNSHIKAMFNKSLFSGGVYNGSLRGLMDYALLYAGSSFTVGVAESTPEPAPSQELAESAPEPAPSQEFAESAPEPAPPQEVAESAPEPAPSQELAESSSPSSPLVPPSSPSSPLIPPSSPSSLLVPPSSP